MSRARLYIDSCVNARDDMVVVYVLRPAAEGAGHEVLQLLRREGAYMGGTWQFCGGRIEPGESAAQAALRELREETGLVPREFSFLSHVESFYLPQADAICRRVGFCVPVGREDAITLNAEHTDHRWIARRQIRRLVTWPGERAALAEIFREHLRPGLASPHRRLDPARLPHQDDA